MDAIILRNIRLDIQVVKPLAQKVLLSQKRLLKTLQSYKEHTSKPGYDEDEANKLLWLLWRLDQQQRSCLAQLREAEEKSAGGVNGSSSLLCLEQLGDNSPLKDDLEDSVHKSADVEPQVMQSLEFRITGSAIIPKSGGFSNEESMEIILEPCDSSTSDSVASFPPSEVPSTVETLAKEQMEREDPEQEDASDADDLLQKIERLGSRTTQDDFLAAIGLVHKSNYAQAEKKLAEEKLLRSNGKKITTGPWQVMDIPTKVTSRRSNYLSSNYLVTVRQRDPYRHVPAPSSSTESGVKTRNQESSRASSRTSSRASSPVNGSRVDNRELTGAFYNSRANNLLKARAARAQRRKAKIRLGSKAAPKPIADMANNPPTSSSKQISRVVPMLSSGMNPLKSLATPVMINNSVSITPVVPQASRPPVNRKRSDSSETGIVFLPLNKIKQTAGTSTMSTGGGPPLAKKPAWTVAVSSDGTPIYNVHYEEPASATEAKTAGLSVRLNMPDKSVKVTDKALKPKPSNTDKGKEQQSADTSPSAAGKLNTPQTLSSGKVLYFPFKERMKSFSFTPTTTTTTTSSSAAARPVAAPQQQSAAPAQNKKPIASTPISLLKPIIIMPGSKSPSGATYIPLQSIGKGRPSALMQLSTLMKNNIRPGKILAATNKLGSVSVRPAAPQASVQQVEEQAVQQQPSKPQSSKDASDNGPTIIVADMSS